MPTLKKGMLASFLSVSQSFLAKSVGLISTLVLARVLVPEDFGLVATATIFMGFVHILSQTGGSDYIIKADSVNDDMLNTNWTINLILQCLVGIIAAILSPTIAEYFGDQRLTLILYFFAFSAAMTGLKNPGIELLRREQNILPILINNIVGKVLAVAAAISVALIYESYWALIIGQFVSQVSRIIGSYYINDHRPKLCLTNFKHQFSFSFWIIAQASLGYGRTQLDSFLVASNFTQAQLGQYNVMKYIAFLPNTLLLGPATGPLLRQLSSIKHTNGHFKVSCNVSSIIALTVALPVAGIMYLCATPLVSIILGEQWNEYSSLFALFAFLVPAYVMFHQSIRLLTMFGDTKHIFIFEIFSFFTIYGCLFVVGLNDIHVFTMVRVSLENVVSLVFLFYAITKYTGISTFLKLMLLCTPIVAINALAAFVSTLIPSLSNDYLQIVSISFSYFLVCIIFLMPYVFLGKSKSRELQSVYNYAVKIVSSLKVNIK